MNKRAERNRHRRKIKAKRICKLILRVDELQDKLKPHLFELSNDQSGDIQRSSITGNEAKADVSVNGFWQQYQRAFFDAKVRNL